MRSKRAASSDRIESPCSLGILMLAVVIMASHDPYANPHVPITVGAACFDPARLAHHAWLFPPGLVVPGVPYVRLHLRDAARS